MVAPTPISTATEWVSMQSIARALIEVKVRRPLRTRCECTPPTAMIIGIGARFAETCSSVEDDMGIAFAHRVLGLLADARERVLQGIRAAVHGEGAIDLDRLVAEMLAEHRVFAVGQERRFEHQHVVLRQVLVEHVVEIAEPGLEAHHPEFAQADRSADW